MTRDNHGWLLANYKNRQLFHRIDLTDWSAKMLLPVPGNGLLDVNNGRIHSADLLTVVDPPPISNEGYSADTGMRIHYWSIDFGWHTEQLSREVTVNSISLAPDGGFWLAGYRHPRQHALWFKPYLKSPLRSIDVHIGLTSKIKFWLDSSMGHHVFEQFHAIHAESRPIILRADPPDLFYSPFCYVLLQSKHGSWKAHKLSFGVQLLSLNEGVLAVTVDGDVFYAGADATFIRQTSTTSLKTALSSAFPELRGNIRVFRADALDRDRILVVAGIYSDEICLGTAVLRSSNGGHEWRSIKTTHANRKEPVLIDASWIRGTYHE